MWLLLGKVFAVATPVADSVVGATQDYINYAAGLLRTAFAVDVVLAAVIPEGAVYKLTLIGGKVVYVTLEIVGGTVVGALFSEVFTK